MQLTYRGLLLLLPTVAWLALAAVWLPFVAVAVLWLIVASAVLFADWRLAPRPADWELARRHDERLSLARWNAVEVDVRARRARRSTRIELRDEPPASFAIEGDPVLHAAAQQGAATLLYRVRPARRGDYRFGSLHLRWESPLRLLTRQARFEAATAVKVYPDLTGVRAYDLVVRKNRIWELGLRATRVLGAGNEFERLRDYQPDDEYRRINWKATARRGKPISAEFQTERSQNLVALLDVGRMMRSPVGGPAGGGDIDKLDYAINAVLLLAYVAAAKGDRVGMLAFADRPLVWLAPRPGKGQFYRMLEVLYAIQAQPVEPDFGAALSYFSVQQQKRSLAVLFTDLTGSVSMESLVAQMTRIRRSHLPLLVTVADPAVQHLVEQPVHDSRSLYERTAAEQRAGRARPGRGTPAEQRRRDARRARRRAERRRHQSLPGAQGAHAIVGGTGENVNTKTQRHEGVLISFVSL